jgi:hypothetical protein
MHHWNIVRRLSMAAAVLVICAASARPAHAQGFISPFYGYNFSGDASCPEITDCKDKHGNYGVSFGALGSFVGFEAELARTSDFLGETPTQSTNVVTFMGNLMLAPKFGPIQPYGLVGAGLIRTTIETAGEDDDENQIGWDAGGGLIIFFNRHVGLRGDVRYFHSFEVIDLGRIFNLPLEERHLDFGRVSGALVFKF